MTHVAATKYVKMLRSLRVNRYLKVGNVDDCPNRGHSRQSQNNGSWSVFQKSRETICASITLSTKAFFESLQS